MNLPNKLTVSRMILIPFILLFMLPLPFAFAGAWNAFIGGMAGKIIALILFLVASFTDMLDGRIARKYNIVTNLGKFLDPIADKMLVISVLVALVQLGRLHSAVTVVVIAREFIVTGIRLLAAEQGTVIAASMFGKLKTVTQMIAISWLMLEPIVLRAATTPGGTGVLYTIGNVLTVLAVLMTILSGLDYFMKNRHFFREPHRR